MREYTDDSTIRDADSLWRRVPPWHLVYDENDNVIRPTSAAFEDSPDGSPMSVLLAQIVADTGRGPKDAVRGFPGFAMASITAGLSRRCRQGVARDPLTDEPAHAVVFGPKTQSVRRKLAKGADWIIPPPGQSVEPA